MLSWNHETAQVNGIELHHVRTGTGFPLFLVHGWPEFWRAWRKNIPKLTESFEVLVPDLCGFGASENPDVPPREGYEVDAHVDDLLAFADVLNFGEFWFVSHDLGNTSANASRANTQKSSVGCSSSTRRTPTIGDRWRDPEHIEEIWYQSFNQLPWAADLVGSSREACKMHIRHFLDHWAGDPSTFHELAREAWVDTYLQYGNPRVGSTGTSPPMTHGNN